MMFESKDTNVLSSNTIVNRIWEARHKVASDVPSMIGHRSGASRIVQTP